MSSKLFQRGCNEKSLRTTGLERSNQYTYGRPVIANNDHLLLEAIFKKPLNQALKRQQILIMRLKCYSIEFRYVPGNTNQLLTLSVERFPN